MRDALVVKIRLQRIERVAKKEDLADLTKRLEDLLFNHQLKLRTNLPWIPLSGRVELLLENIEPVGQRKAIAAAICEVMDDFTAERTRAYLLDSNGVPLGRSKE